MDELSIAENRYQKWTAWIDEAKKTFFDNSEVGIKAVSSLATKGYKVG